MEKKLIPVPVQLLCAILLLVFILLSVIGCNINPDYDQLPAEKKCNESLVAGNNVKCYENRSVLSGIFSNPVYDSGSICNVANGNGTAVHDNIYIANIINYRIHKLRSE